MALTATLRHALGRLHAAGVPDPEISAKLLLGAVKRLKSPAAVDAALAAGKPLSDDQQARFAELVERRCKREPLQYILGDWDFAGLTVKVRKPALIPRPETEVLASLVDSTARRLAAQAQRQGGRPVLLMEVGIGSGALSLALLRSLAKQPVRIVGIDVNPEAVALAQENADLVIPQIAQETGVPQSVLKSRLLFLCRDALAFAGPADPAVSAWLASGAAPFDLLFSNPPYIPTEEGSTLEPEVSQWEDPGALFGGPPHGLGFTLRMLEQAARGAQEGKGWLRRGEAGAAHVLLETHIDHPALFALGLQPAAAVAATAAAVPAGQSPSVAAAAAAAWCDVPPEKILQLLSAGGPSLQRTVAAAPLLVPPPGYPLPSAWRTGAGGETPVPALDLGPGLARLVAAAQHCAPAALPVFSPAVAAAYAWRQAYCDLTGRPRFVHLVAE